MAESNKEAVVTEATDANTPEITQAVAETIQEAAPEAIVVEADSITPQQKLLTLIGKFVTVDDGRNKPHDVILAYVGECDVIAKEGQRFSFNQVIGEAE